MLQWKMKDKELIPSLLKWEKKLTTRKIEWLHSCIRAILMEIVESRKYVLTNDNNPYQGFYGKIRNEKISTQPHDLKCTIICNIKVHKFKWAKEM